MGHRDETTVTLRHRTRGGLLSLRVLRVLAETAETLGAGRVVLTARQEVDVPGTKRDALRKLWVRLPGEAIDLPQPHDEPNIVTTAPVAGLAPGRPWLVEGVFQDILNAVASRPAFPVTLGDPTQAYLPAFGGVLGFLAAEDEHRWQVVFRWPGDDRPAVHPGELSSADVAWAIDRVQQAWPMFGRRDPLALLHETLGARLLTTGTQAPAQDACFEAVPGAVVLPMPRGGWPAAFIEALCVWAGGREGLTFRATPWRTLLLPGLDADLRRDVAGLCLGHRVPFAPSPWRAHLWTTDGAAAAAESLAEALEARCPANPGYGLAVTQGDHPAPDLSVQVEHERVRRWFFGFQDRFRIAVHGIRGPWTGLAEAADGILAALAKDTAHVSPESGPKASENNREPTARDDDARACRDCGTVYAPAYGDPMAGVPAGTPFDALPDGWECPVCGGSPARYGPMPRHRAA